MVSVLLCSLRLYILDIFHNENCYIPWEALKKTDGHLLPSEILIDWSRIGIQSLKLSLVDLMCGQGWELVLFMMSPDELISCLNTINTMMTVRFTSLVLAFPLTSGVLYPSAHLTSSRWGSHMECGETKLYFQPQSGWHGWHCHLPHYWSPTNSASWHKVPAESVLWHNFSSWPLDLCLITRENQL
jgi:hypothetical protein